MQSFALTVLFVGTVANAWETSPPPRALEPVSRLSLNTDDWIRSVAFSPDEKTIAATTFTGKIVLWDVATGQELCQAAAAEDAQTGQLPGLAFSRDGKRLATIHDTRLIAGRGRARIDLWDIDDQRQLRKTRTFFAQAQFPVCAVWRVVFSPDGKLLATGEPEGTIVVWETDTGRQRLRFQGGVAAAFTPDGRSLVSVTHDGTIHHWAAGSNQSTDPSPDAAAADFIHADAVVFGPSGRLVAVGDGFTTWVKEVATGRTVRRLELPYAVIPVALSADERMLAATAKGGLCLFDVTTGREMGWRPGTGAAAFSNDGQYLAWADWQSIILDKAPFAGTETGQPPPSRDPPDCPLQAKLIANRKQYELDLGGLRPAEFSQEILFGHPPTPLVELSLELRNTGNKPLTIRRHGIRLDQPTFYLVGPGAMNFFELPENTQVIGVNEPKTPSIVLAPGATYTCRIVSLGNSDRAYWLLPGDYNLYARCDGAISPTPKRADDAGDGYGYVTLRTPPVKLGVSPARGPSSEPLEKRPNPPALGTARRIAIPGGCGRAYPNP
jgi:hypothetical protein